jgi:heterodisulfide reductase subunit B2
MGNKAMKIGMYPGCSLMGTGRDYNESVIAIAEACDLKLEQVPDWNCCGATAAHNMNKELSLALPARILAQAEKAGMNDIVVPCAACYSRLMVTQYELNHNPELKNKISEILEMDFRGTTTILNVVQMIDKHITPVLPTKVKKTFNHKVACYYGCLMVRPHKILQYDQYEDPQGMDNVIRLLGGTAIEWGFKIECCGAGLTMSKTEVVGKLSGKIINDATRRGAQAIVVACPMCHSNLDMRRPAINEYLGKKSDIPIIYITQAIGLALGIDEKTLGLKRHFVPVKMEEYIPPAPEPKRPKAKETTKQTVAPEQN